MPANYWIVSHLFSNHAGARFSVCYFESKRFHTLFKRNHLNVTKYVGHCKACSVQFTLNNAYTIYFNYLSNS